MATFSTEFLQGVVTRNSISNNVLSCAMQCCALYLRCSPHWYDYMLKSFLFGFIFRNFPCHIHCLSTVRKCLTCVHTNIYNCQIQIETRSGLRGWCSCCWFAGSREHLYVSSSSLYGFHKYTKISFILNAMNIQTLAHTPWSVNEINSWNLPTVLIGLYLMISHTCIHIPHFDTYHIAYKSNISPCKHFPHVAIAAHRSIVFGLKLEN